MDKTDTKTDTNGFFKKSQIDNPLVLLVWQGSSVGESAGFIIHSPPVISVTYPLKQQTQTDTSAINRHTTDTLFKHNSTTRAVVLRLV